MNLLRLSLTNRQTYACLLTTFAFALLTFVQEITGTGLQTSDFMGQGTILASSIFFIIVVCITDIANQG